METDENETVWLVLIGLGAVFVFGGSVLAWLTARSAVAVEWLLEHGVVVPSAQALVAISGVGLDLPRIIVAVLVLVLLTWFASKIVGMTRRTA